MNIMNILGINKIFKVNQTTHAGNIEKTESVKKGDSVLLSSEAKMSVEVKKYIEIVKNSSDVRADKVALAKQRLKNGDYSNPEIFEKVAERLTQKFSIGDKIIDSLGEKEK